MIQQMLAIWSLVPLPFLKPAWTSGSSWFKLLKPGLENFGHYFTSMLDECNCAVVWALLGIAFLWHWNENWPFPVLWPLLSFPNLLACWMQHFHSIIFQDLKELNWNSIISVRDIVQETRINTIPLKKKCNAEDCSNYRTIALISHASKVMLKIL